MKRLLAYIDQHKIGTRVFLTFFGFFLPLAYILASAGRIHPVFELPYPFLNPISFLFSPHFGAGTVLSCQSFPSCLDGNWSNFILSPLLYFLLGFALTSDKRKRNLLILLGLFVLAIFLLIISVPV